MATDNPEGDRKAILARHAFFRDLPTPTLDRFVRHARPETFKAGARVFNHGDEGRGLLAIMSGYVRITVPGQGKTDLVLNLVGPNELFGEMALLDGEPRSADATALTLCHVFVLERRDFRAILMDQPEVGVKLLEIMSRRLRSTSRQLFEANFGSVEARLAKAILSLAELSGHPNRQRPRVLMTQRGLGEMVGVSREAVNRHLRAWERAELVVLEPGACTIAKMEELVRLAENLSAER